MLPIQTRRGARQARRAPHARRTAALGVAFGVLALTGLTAAIPAVAATPASASLTASVALATGDERSAAQTLREIAENAQSTLDAARAALTGADTLTADIAASGLDLGAVSTDVDTTALRAAIGRLSALDVIPALLLPDVTADTATQLDLVLARTALLRDRLDAAQAQKAAELAAAEAAAQAQREAEAAAAALAASNTPEGAQASARQLASANYGWGDDQFSCLVSLWNKESSWNYQAYNASSGATGIPQSLPGSKMASAGADWQSSAVTQISWGLQYIGSVYGSPCSAWSHSQSTGWY